MQKIIFLFAITAFTIQFSFAQNKNQSVLGSPPSNDILLAILLGTVLLLLYILIKGGKKEQKINDLNKIIAEKDAKIKQETADATTEISKYKNNINALNNELSKERTARKSAETDLSALRTIQQNAEKSENTQRVKLRKEQENQAQKVKEYIDSLSEQEQLDLEQKLSSETSTKIWTIKNGKMPTVFTKNTTCTTQEMQSLILKIKEEKEQLKREQAERERQEQQRKEQQRQAQIIADRQAKEKAERDAIEAEKRKIADAKRAKEKAIQDAIDAENRKKQDILNKLLQNKPNYQAFQNVLQENGITTLFHFTDRSNLAKIKAQGGLFSWHYLATNDITIPKAGGDDLSKRLDRLYGLQDFVRLSFCESHPMQFKLKKEGCDLVVLQIKTDVVYLQNTCFSDMNATDSGHTHGSNLADLKRVNFAATKMNFLSKEDPNFKYHQAEVMVKTWIPLEYITNIHNFLFFL